MFRGKIYNYFYVVFVSSHLLFKIGAAKVGLPFQQTYFSEIIVFFPHFEVKKFKNKAKNNISLFNPSRKMLVLLQKCGLSHLIFKI
jgi:hypothetical protein